MSYKETGTCCFCGKKYTHWGNSIDPLIHPSGIDARCCDVCNMTIVIPNRLVLREKLVFTIYNCENDTFYNDYDSFKLIFNSDIANAYLFSDYDAANLKLEEIKKAIKEDRDCYSIKDISKLVVKGYYIRENR